MDIKQAIKSAEAAEQELAEARDIVSALYTREADTAERELAAASAIVRAVYTGQKSDAELGKALDALRETEYALGLLVALIRAEFK